MRWFYDPGYDYGGGLTDAPREIHGFLLRKPSEIRQQLLDADAVLAGELVSPTMISTEDLRRVHDPGVIDGLRSSASVAAAIELEAIALLPPETVFQAVVGPQLLAAGGTYAALRAGMSGEWAINLSGGYHHARRDLSHGFCLINDVAVGLARLRQEGLARRTLIIDLDLHQGDGNATVFQDDEGVYTVSVHEEDIFPIPKVKSDLDIGLPACTGDGDYLAAVDDALEHAEQHFDAEMIVYVAGSDPYIGDPLGSLEVSWDGMLARDRRVASFAVRRGCPLVVLPAGGYSLDSPSIAAAGFREIAALEPRGSK